MAETTYSPIVKRVNITAVDGRRRFESRMDFSPLSGNPPHVKHELVVRVFLSPFRVEHVETPEHGEQPNYKDGIIPGHFKEHEIHYILGLLEEYHKDSNNNRLQKWPDSKWIQFRSILKLKVEQIWNVLWARPSEGMENVWMRYLAATKGYKSNVVPSLKLDLNLKLVNLPSEADVRILCLNTTTRFRSRMSLSWVQGGSFGILDWYDIYTYEYEGNIINCDAAHEFGHYLGFSHVAANIEGNPYPAIGAKPGDTEEYGITEHQRGNVMGMGTRVEPWNAAPWLNHIYRHFSGPEKPKFVAYVQNHH